VEVVVLPEDVGGDDGSEVHAVLVLGVAAHIQIESKGFESGSSYFTLER
jgi:hypothetical protein